MPSPKRKYSGIERELIRALTLACETAKSEIVGFQWLTHDVDYEQFPQSLVVTWMFDSEASRARVLASPIPGHGTNPIVTGSGDVLFDGLSAARLSDVSACGSPIAGNVSPTVFINGLNAATLGSVGDHGNTIIAGSGTVIIGSSGGGAPFSPVASLNIQSAFNDRFQLVDKRSGRPIANRCYAVKHEDGRIEYGQSDQQGFTSLIINSSRAERVEIYVED